MRAPPPLRPLDRGHSFVYYVLIRMGEQAGDTGLLSSWLSMWGANIVLGVIAAALLVLNHREAAFDPLDPRALHELGAPGAAGAGARGHPRAGPGDRSLAGGGGHADPPHDPPLPPSSTATSPDPGCRTSPSSFLAFTSIYVLGEFMDLIDDIQQNHVKERRSPLLPVSPVDDRLHGRADRGARRRPATLGLLARRNRDHRHEGGRGERVYRAAGPVLGMGLLASLALYGLQEFVLPSTTAAAAPSSTSSRAGRPSRPTSSPDWRWLVASDDRFYNFDYIVERDRPPAQWRRGAPAGRGGEFSVYGLSIYDVEPKTWDLRERTFVARATWISASRSYDLEHGWRRTEAAQSSYQPFVHRRVRGDRRRGPRRRDRAPAVLQAGGETLRHDGLRRAPCLHRLARGPGLRRGEAAGAFPARKIAFPMVGLVMTLLAVPFSFVVARRGALWPASGSGDRDRDRLLGRALGIFEALGNNAYLHPALAAWAPNLIFGAAGLYLILTLET
ncbi:MAG: LptF/LptG family permease [Vicinamibacteria bacterium]